MSGWRALLALAVLTVARPADAQNVSAYVAGSLFLSPWSPREVSGSPSLSYDNAGRGDRFLPGGTVEVGLSLQRRFDLGVEVALAPRRTIDQAHFYFNPFEKDARYRDTTIFATARARAGRASAAVALVAGAGLVHQSALERTAPGRFGVTGYTFGPFGPDVAVSRWGRGAMAGIDVSTRVSPRVSIGPQFRLLYTDRGDIAAIPDFRSFGIPKVTYRIGLMIRSSL
ncbi:MAG: hypothetical protein AB7U83_06650 [Vicinamibacterales bacterium]